MRYTASVHNEKLVVIEVVPGWLGRLLGRRTRRVYVHRLLRADTNRPVWLTMGGRTVYGRMLDAIEELPLALPAIPK